MYFRAWGTRPRIQNRFATSMNVRRHAHQPLTRWDRCKNSCSESMMNIIAMKWYNSPETKESRACDGKQRRSERHKTRDGGKVESELVKILIGKNPKLHSFLLLNALWIIFYYSWTGISSRQESTPKSSLVLSTKNIIISTDLAFLRPASTVINWNCQKS